jgi:hypothetical protein
VALEAAAKAVVVSIANACACIDDDIDIGQLVLMLTKGFSDQALDPIASDCIADDTCGSGQSEARRMVAAVTDEHGEHCIAQSARVAIDAIELRFFVKPLSRGEGSG